MTLPLSSAVPADVAERQRDAAESRREAFLPTREAALEDLVEKIMAGECYPPKSKHCVCMAIVQLDYLDKGDSDDMIRGAIFSSSAAIGWCYLHDSMEGHVRAYLEGDGRKWVDLRQQDMAEEAEEESGV